MKKNPNNDLISEKAFSSKDVHQEVPHQFYYFLEKSFYSTSKKPEVPAMKKTSQHINNKSSPPTDSIRKSATDSNKNLYTYGGISIRYISQYGW